MRRIKCRSTEPQKAHSLSFSTLEGVLQGLPADQMRSLLQASTVLNCRAGDTLLREGEAGREMFLILDGMARTSHDNGIGGASHSSMLGKGEVFREMALVSLARRHITVKAVTELEVLVISQDFLNRAMKSLPDVAMRLLYNLSGVLCQKLLDVTQNKHRKDPGGKY